MNPSTQSHLLQVCRTCGGGAPVDVHFCPSCTRILTLGRQGDYFSFLGLPRKLNLDAAHVERQFRALSRQFHPDFFYNASPAERRASLERSSYLNDAYRTLKQPATRVAYLLEVEGALQPSDHDVAKKVPASLLEEVFALNEELDEVRDLRSGGAPEAEWRARLSAAAAPIEAKRAEHEAQLASLSERWDALDDGDVQGRATVLAALRERVLERNYINNLLATIEREATGAGRPQL
ncbi:MAG TPA: Fe-S protein assembly co-chaperone HscB [Vicinamibacterales bacterium]|nr:Fe-S protein assembly co-chaperone HscB [Vicinamibacterales bacterium]